ncbi:nicotinate-nucleotide adenylyltransferase [Microbulbifer sp. TYP-18]|uniref:nicotinate-nucleotide adenylyltransferase n=1 Tax=Microbulbifer sp. TYP-18 TaxID=3230024 RepID=UPI0034C6AA3F
MDTSASNRRRSIALFGGTFDPVHFGHLRMALELRQALGFDQMRLLPCRQPHHRQSPRASVQQRRDMLTLALEKGGELQLDERELHRAGPTFTVDTLEDLRAELGTEVSISFCMGLDSLLTLPSWHRRERLLQVAHLVVVARPGWRLPEDGEVARLLREHAGTRAQIREEAQGRLLVCEQTPLPISASQIRRLLAQRQSPRFLLPAAVLQYIEDNQLYGITASGGS